MAAAGDAALWEQYLDADDDDASAGTGEASSSNTGDQHPSESYLVGFLIAYIVGLRHYSGTISGREMVGLVREPLNPHDSNAIKVLNTRGAQVGYIERPIAAVLAPLLDTHLLAAAEAIVPKPPPTTNNNNRKPFRLPVQLHLFARPDAVPRVLCAVCEAGFHLISDADPMFSLSESVIIQERKPNKKDPRDMDRIFALGSGNDGKIPPPPLEPPKDIIVTQLFPHQKDGLGWLVSKENSTDLPPFWMEKDSGGFHNVLTNYQPKERPEPLRGGILADDMGLGKTLTLLSLIATNRPGDSAGCDKSMSVGGSISQPGKRTTVGSRKRRKVDHTDVSEPRATLIVCPPSVLSTWITQLEEHTIPGSLKVYMYYGERTKEPEKLLRHDIVLTTYNTLSVEFSSPDSPIKDVQWFRVILDEAHQIKNFAAQQTKAVIALKAERRWVVTGTPIQNSSYDLFSLMAFLKFEPFSVKYFWQTMVQRPLDQGLERGISRLQAVIGAISLRRTKGEQNGKKCLVGLPPKTVETCLVELSIEEREKYDRMESEAQNTVRDYIEADTAMRNYSTVLLFILRLRQICNDVMLCPPDIQSLLPSNILGDVSMNPELLKKLASLVEDGDDFDCPVCLCPPVKTTITSCAHIFCQFCILKILKKNDNPRCPICRNPLSKSDLFNAPPSQSSSAESTTVDSGRPMSSKVSTLLKFLLESKRQSPSTKSVVFSQFRKMLTMLEEPLKAAGFGVFRLDGSMNAKKRTEVIKKFGTGGPSAPTVLLASIKAAGVGINLTAASRVYLFEPWWNPAVEEQAMDRVHRIGQHEEVRVIRLIVKDSIEERILELQERKRKLARGVFGKGAAKEQKQMRVEELRTIMRLVQFRGRKILRLVSEAANPRHYSA